jgi:hypothetical protein
MTALPNNRILSKFLPSAAEDKEIKEVGKRRAEGGSRLSLT